MNGNDLKSACLAVGLAAAWAACPGPASADTRVAETEVTPTVMMSHVHFLYSANTSGSSYFASSAKIAGNLAAGSSSLRRCVVVVEPEAWAWRYGPCTCAVIGLYDGDGDGDVDEQDVSAGAVSIQLNDSYASDVLTNGWSWSEVFTSATLSQIATALWNNDNNTLAQFTFSESQWRFVSLGWAGSMVNFRATAGPTGGGTALGMKPQIGMNNRAAWDSIMSAAGYEITTCLWGRVTPVDDYSFTIDDGTAAPITVYSYDYASVARKGDYVRVAGNSYRYSEACELYCDKSRIRKLD